MNVCLINPMSPFLADAKRQPPLGLLYIASVLEAHGAEVKVLDYCLKDYGIPPKDYDIYGFTATTPQYSYALRLAKETEGYKVIGGPHASAVNIENTVWNVVVKGEGERATSQLLWLYKRNRRKEQVTLKLPLIQNLDSIPFPARHLVPLKQYTRQVEGKIAGTLIASRGCPFACAFCDFSVFGKQRYRLRSVGNVIAEVDHLKERYGYKALQFLDDSITANRKWILKLCKELESREMLWRAWTRVDILDLELLKSMRRAGCVDMALGIESGSNRILKNMNKGTTVQQGIKAIKLVKKAGIRVKVFLMVGFPTETKETVAETIEFVKKTNPDKWVLGTFLPVPGSDTFKNPSKYGIKRLDGNFENYILADAEGKGRLPFEPLNGNREELESLRDILLNYLKTREGGPI